MKLIIDTEEDTLTCENNDQSIQHPLYSQEAFEILSKNWVKLGWNLKYAYQFSWLGHPIIQLPDDIIRIQEVIFTLKPDVIIETGVAYGGSLFFYSTLCKILGKGRVIGVERFLRPHNREAIEKDPLYSYITLIDGDSEENKTVKKVKSLIKKEETVLVILDSNHTKKHVLAELNAYCDLVTLDSYIIATDGIMKDLSDIPNGKEDWAWDNPADAVLEFAQKHPEFEKVPPPAPLFNKSQVASSVTQWEGAWLKRKY